MRTPTRLAIAGLIALLLVAPAVAAASAAGNATSETAASNPTNYSISDLAETGTSHEGAPDSMRYLGAYGSATVRYTPPGPLSGDWEYLDPAETTVNSNELTLRTVRLGPSESVEQDLTIHVVAWQEGTVTTKAGNETAEASAAVNVTHRTHQVTLERGYDDVAVSLPPNYEGTQKITMWVDEYPDARWVFDHKSTPSMQAVGVDSRGDLWLWGAENILLVAVPGLLISTKGVQWMIGRAAAPPMKGPLWWGFVGGLFALGLAAVGWFQTATLIAHVPQVIGGAVALVGFVAMLEVSGRRNERVLFERHELAEKKNAKGDEVPDAIRKDVDEYTVVRHDDGSLRPVKSGIRPFFARVFADPAKIPEDLLSTLVEVRGKWSRSYLAHPDADEPLYWTPAHWHWSNPFLSDSTVEGEDDDRRELRIWERVRPASIMVGVAGLAVGWMAGAAISLELLGLALGTLPTVVMAVEARDGYADWQPAPAHMRKSMASLTIARDELHDAETIEEHERARIKAESQTALDARSQQRKQDRTIVDQLVEETLGHSADPVDGDERDPDEEYKRKRGRESDGDRDNILADGGDNKND